jgi:hypothetical protein
MGAGRALRSMGLTRRRFAVAAGVAVLFVAGISVILAAPGHSQAVQDGAVAALLVAAAGTVVVLVRQPGKGGPDLAALVTTGLAGAALATLLPQTQAYLIGYLALAGLGLRAPLRPWAAVAGAVAVFAAMNAGYLLVANGSVTGLMTQDIGLDLFSPSCGPPGSRKNGPVLLSGSPRRLQPRGGQRVSLAAEPGHPAAAQLRERQPARRDRDGRGIRGGGHRGLELARPNARAVMAFPRPAPAPGWPAPGPFGVPGPGSRGCSIRSRS